MTKRQNPGLTAILLAAMLATAGPATAQTIELDAGFSGDPRRIALANPGGTVSAQDFLASQGAREEACQRFQGFISEEPDATLDYRAGSAPLFISAASEVRENFSVIVKQPNGQYTCDLNPGLAAISGVTIPNPQSGVYEIHVGVAEDQFGVPGNIYISERSYATPDGEVIDHTASARFGNFTINGGSGQTERVRIEVGGPIEFQDMGFPNATCRGDITSAPTVQIDWRANGGDLFIYTQGDENTSLMMRLPNGAWFCNRDSDLGGGGNAGVAGRGAPAGVLDVYIGKENGGAVVPSELVITTIEP